MNDAPTTQAENETMIKVGTTYTWSGNTYRVTQITWKFVHTVQVSEHGRDYYGTKSIEKRSFFETATEI
tara:strand:+ start:130 stop:336 length:207 start_codon:yes stop_codon:yes gene_type:complete